ncbi:MAG: ABC transporter permease [Bacilli bacterium]|nr:ABC transporter permease [Bacilli bacterium]
MTVFKAFLKILNKNKFIVILYSVFLITFGGFNMKNQSTTTNFSATKPDILVVNKDENKGITKNLIEYIKKNSKTVKIKDTEEARDDALFYQDVDYIIYIQKGYRNSFLQGNNPEIKVKSGINYNSSLAEIILKRYINVSNTYRKSITNEDKLIKKINETLNNKVDVKMTSKVDITSLAKITFYYNFASYSILACLVYVICLILASFKNEPVLKRTIISSMNYKKHNTILLLSNGLFSCLLWIIYVILSFVLLGKPMCSTTGIIYLINSFIFTVCATTLAFFIANLVTNKNAINGIVNVIALGSSFLCGAFVPMRYLPDSVLMIAHALPSYYYIKTNEKLTSIETLNFTTLKPLIINMITIIIFSILFIVLGNIVSKRKRKIG